MQCFTIKLQAPTEIPINVKIQQRMLAKITTTTSKLPSYCIDAAKERGCIADGRCHFTKQIMEAHET